jgi:ABC-type nitrate/sulfonate/bicarbonate transport system substrate-binding protein
MQKINVIAFPGAPNLPTFAAIEQGYFAEAGLEVNLVTTPSSVFQFEAFGRGDFDIAFTAFDNVVAYDEGQGVAKLDPRPDFRALMGATQIGLSVVVAPEIETAADLRGKTLALDAVGTGFAFVLYDVLASLGLPRDAYTPVAVGATPERWASVKAGAHAGTITIEPFTSLAKAAGFKVLAESRQVFPRYQGGVVAARRDWAEAHTDQVVAFLLACLKGVRWTRDPANREAAAALLQARMPEIKPGVVGAVMDSLLSPETGLTPDGELLAEGMAAVLDLRSRYGRGGEVLTDAQKYLWLQPYHQALARLSQG